MTKILISDLVVSSGVKFGTSGMRGLVTDITDKVCWCYTTAFIQFLEQKYDLKKSTEIVVAHDLRESSPRITAVIIKAIIDAGFIPVFCGEISSPAVMSYGIEHQIASIMITGSHIPEDRNGIKFNTPFGEILKQDEAVILGQTVDFPEQQFNADDMSISKLILPEVNTDGINMFIKRYIDFFPKNCLSGKKIGLYEHSSVASILLKEILQKLGADVLPLGYSKKFISVDTEAIRPQDIVLAKQWMGQHNLDSIVSTDGDGDRPLISDENGNWLKGDIVGILTAKYLNISSIVTPVSSNTALEKSGIFDNIIRTKIGSPFVIDAMNDLLESGNKAVGGYEANGGFLLATTAKRNGCELSPLATRDATIAILSVLMLSIEQNCSISELLSDLPPRYTESSKIDHVESEQSNMVLRAAQQTDSKLINELLSYKDNASVINIDATDGVRITFANDDIVHFRGSGNAPELRCYTESVSYDQASELNKFCVSVVKNFYL